MNEAHATLEDNELNNKKGKVLSTPLVLVCLVVIAFALIVVSTGTTSASSSSSSIVLRTDKLEAEKQGRMSEQRPSMILQQKLDKDTTGINKKRHSYDKASDEQKDFTSPTNRGELVALAPALKALRSSTVGNLSLKARSTRYSSAPPWPSVLPPVSSLPSSYPPNSTDLPPLRWRVVGGPKKSNRKDDFTFLAGVGTRAAGSCEGNLLIIRQMKNTGPPTMDVSKDSSFNNWVRETSGPDAFRVTITGFRSKRSDKSSTTTGKKQGDKKDGNNRPVNAVDRTSAFVRLASTEEDLMLLKQATSAIPEENLGGVPFRSKDTTAIYIARWRSRCPISPFSGSGDNVGAAGGAVLSLHVEVKWDWDDYKSLNDLKDTASGPKDRYLLRGGEGSDETFAGVCECSPPPPSSSLPNSLPSRTSLLGGAKTLPLQTKEKCRNTLGRVGRYVHDSETNPGVDEESAATASSSSSSWSSSNYYPWKGAGWKYELDDHPFFAADSPDSTLTQMNLPTTTTCPQLVDFAKEPHHLQKCLHRLNRENKRPLRILFTGDSQIRTVYRHWESVLLNKHADKAKGGNMSVACGGGSSRQKEGRNADCFLNTVGATSSKHKEESGIAIWHEIFFLWDPYLEALREGVDGVSGRRQLILDMQIDFLVFGLGAWPASFGQWSFGQFRKAMIEVENTLTYLEEHSTSSKRHHLITSIWAGSPAWPKPRKMPQFRITNYRLAIFNYIGEKVLLLGDDEKVTLEEMTMESTGANTSRRRVKRRFRLDLFQVSLPFLSLHRGDGMHYDWSVVLYTAVNLLGNMIC